MPVTDSDHLPPDSDEPATPRSFAILIELTPPSLPCAYHGPPGLLVQREDGSEGDMPGGDRRHSPLDRHSQMHARNVSRSLI